MPPSKAARSEQQVIIADLRQAIDPLLFCGIPTLSKNSIHFRYVDMFGRRDPLQFHVHTLSKLAKFSDEVLVGFRIFSASSRCEHFDVISKYRTFDITYGHIKISAPTGKL